MIEVAIVSLLPKDVSNYYFELRYEIGKRFDLEMNHSVPAHITFKYGFLVEDISIVEEVVQEVCVNNSKSRWQLLDFGSFDHTNDHVVFIDCTPAQGIRDIHESLFEGLRKINWVTWAEFDTIDLHYHVTLASKGVTSEKFELVWSFLSTLEKPSFEFQLDNLALLRIERDPPFISRKFWFPD